MGKSTVLQALLVLRQSQQQAMLPGVGLALNGDLVGLGNAQAVLFRGAAQDRIGITLSAGDQAYPWFFRYAAPGADVLGIESEPAELPAEPIFNEGFHYLQAERIGPRTLHGTSSFEVQQRRSLGKDGRFAVAFLEAFGKESVLPALVHDEAQPRDLGAQVDAWLDEISPGAELRPTAHPDLNAVTLRVRFSASQVVSEDFAATNVGFGLSYVLPVLAAVLSSKPGAMILIENPEAHLHPRGQVALGRLLGLAADCGIQCVVETHSDHLLNGVRLAVKGGLVQPGDVSINFFERRIVDNQIVHLKEAPQIDADGRLSRWPRGFFDQWESSLDALLEG